MFVSSAFHTFLLSDWTKKPSIDFQILVYVQSALIFVESLYDSELNCSHRASSLFCLFCTTRFLCYFYFCEYTGMELNSLLLLLEAAEYLERRDREAEHGYASVLPYDSDFSRKKTKSSPISRKNHNNR
ncbi:Max dimerization protein 4 [Labeo rohita]|uniref:Max dimerization protein 4 n=1 Tax=Labeo rohita TaxID=84645 RepID=A0ABQ8N0F0_LABRO|nr:Max dimerization protein 4 [Labeo rohita]